MESLDLLKIIFANTISATNISSIIKEHSDENILTGDHIICGLVYRIMNPMTDKEIQESLNEYDNLLNESSDEESDEESDDELIEEDKLDDNSNTPRKIKSNNCNCDICIKTRVALLNFNDYIPKDVLGDKFKNSIIDTCNKYNRYI